MVHATNFVESTNVCTIRIEKYSSLWRIFFDVVFFLSSLLCLYYTLYILSKCVYVFWRQWSIFLANSLSRLWEWTKYSNLFTQQHTYIHIFLLSWFIYCCCYFSALTCAFYYLLPMNIVLHSPSIFGNLFWYLYTLLLFCRKSVQQASKQTSGWASQLNHPKVCDWTWKGHRDYLTWIDKYL